MLLSSESPASTEYASNDDDRASALIAATRGVNKQPHNTLRPVFSSGGYSSLSCRMKYIDSRAVRIADAIVAGFLLNCDQLSSALQPQRRTSIGGQVRSKRSQTEHDDSQDLQTAADQVHDSKAEAEAFSASPSGHQHRLSQCEARVARRRTSKWATHLRNQPRVLEPPDHAGEEHVEAEPTIIAMAALLQHKHAENRQPHNLSAKQNPAATCKNSELTVVMTKLPGHTCCLSRLNRTNCQTRTATCTADAVTRSLLAHSKRPRRRRSAKAPHRAALRPARTDRTGDGIARLHQVTSRATRLEQRKHKAVQ